MLLSLDRFRAYATKNRTNRTIFSVKYEGPWTNQRINVHVCIRELSSLAREIRHGASRPDPHETRVSRVSRNVTGRAGSGQEVF